MEERLTQVTLTVNLHASEPFLNDHRPGGQPLLGTVMGIELMVRVARRLAPLPSGLSWRVEQVAILEPLILEGVSATVTVCATRDGRHPSEAINCWVEGLSGADQTVRHFEGRVVMQDPQPPPARAGAMRMPPDFSQCKGVNGTSVYALFFHGPAYQVVGSAWLTGGAMWCELRAGLPALTRSPNERHKAAPQWVELCLQAAGLLEVATNSRMMIPHRIEGVDFFGCDEPDIGAQIFAVARKSNAVSTGGDGECGTDIDLVDLQGKVLLRVRNYQTRPLPFPSDQDALAALALEFRSPPSSQAERVAASVAAPH